MEFIYKAKKGLNEVVEGRIEAGSLDQVIGKLERQGLIAVKIEEAKHPQSAKKQISVLKIGRWGPRQLTLFTQKLYNLSKSRVELLTALGLLQQSGSDPVEQMIIAAIIGDIKDGMTFSQSLVRYPQYFSDFYVNIIRTGESSGQLKNALEQILTRLQRMEDLRRKVRQALAYPIFMVVVGISTVFIMLTFILPRLVGMFDDFQASLPLPTRILISISGFLKQYWFFIIILIVIAAIVIRKQSSRPNSFLLRLKYRFPFIRHLVYKESIANFANSTALLLKSGVTLLSALNITTPIIGNPILIEYLQQVSKDIRDGASFSSALAKFKIFPDLFTQMVKIGEEGGRLDGVLEDIASSYEEQIEADIKIISSLLEPAIILILGVIIGGIVIAVLLPIFNINNLVGS
jgi:type II secretory pathway component PulF